MYIGIDTSCYTTSVACIQHGSIVLDERTVLSVPSGARGLRQSDMLFQHNRNLPPLLEKLFSAIDPSAIGGVGVTVSPTAEPGSYMPVFLAGVVAAESVALSRKAALYRGTHQQMHIRAAMKGNETLKEEERFLAFHLSGGTTDLLSVETDGGRVGRITKLGFSRDLHAGQAVDRTGVLLGCPFPCGPHLEKLALSATNRDIRIPSSVSGTDCSFSGTETAAQRLFESGADRSEIAYAVYDCIARTVAKMARNAAEETGCVKILFAGGVSSSGLLREMLSERLSGRAELYFGAPGLSTDNAVGIALMAEDDRCSSRK
ncbi:MAG: O-sialoglycoprotein endopeptidase [Clostridia bacterium]|nr:O-sialoglycoprotein endopeptidase [Clostridia bacterium]MBR0443763.1 O-sialoglycoprotein endopeptidase [Clostridia bacterium]